MKEQNELNNQNEQKGSGMGFIITAFILFGLFIFVLPEVHTITNAEFWKNLFNINREHKTVSNEVSDKKNADWFNTYVGPLYIGDFFGSTTSSTKVVNDSNMLAFALENTACLDTLDAKYQIIKITSAGSEKEYAVVPESDIKDLINKYFGVNFTYKPDGPNDDGTSYYDSARKAYLRTVCSYSRPDEDYDIKTVTYNKYNVTLSYDVLKTGASCNPVQEDEYVTVGNGEIQLTYNNGNYKFIASSYTANGTCQ